MTPDPRMGFRSVVAALERLTPDAVPVGENGPFAAEGIRFRHDPSLAFSIRDVVSVDSEQGESTRYTVTTSFLGLTGVAGPLPSYIAEEVAQEEEGESPRRDFLDLFHHRLISLLYRAVRQLSVTGEMESDLRDAWSSRILALAGLDAYSALPSVFFPAELLRLAPLLSRGTRSAWGLEEAIRIALGETLGDGEVRVEEFAGAWVELDEAERWQLGRANSRLGRAATLGRRCLDRTGGIRIHVGPVRRPTWERLMQGGDLLAKLQAATELFLQDPLGYSVDVQLVQDEAPRLRLASSGGSRLGRDSWLGASNLAPRLRIAPAEVAESARGPRGA